LARNSPLNLSVAARLESRAARVLPAPRRKSPTMQPLITATEPFGVGLGRGSRRTLSARGMLDAPPNEYLKRRAQSSAERADWHWESVAIGCGGGREAAACSKESAVKQEWCLG
jgi:hypothetical protein